MISSTNSGNICLCRQVKSGVASPLLRAFGHDPAIEVFVGDIHDPVDRLARALQGVDVIVSAVFGDREVFIDGQVNLLRAAEKAGVPRLIPSDCSLALDRLDWDAGTFSYWGDGDQPADFSTYSDTAEWTAEVALDPSAAGRTMRLVGDVLTLKELHQAMERGSGRRLEPRHLGTTDELYAAIERLKATAADPFDYIPLQYTLAMVTGRGKLHPLDNHRYPGVKPTSAEEYFRQAAS